MHYRSKNIVCCGICGELFEQRPKSPQQRCCHPKCKERAKYRRRILKFLRVPIEAPPLTTFLLVLREYIFKHQPNGAIGYTLRSRLLDTLFPLPLIGGTRKTFVGRKTNLPFFEIGDRERDGVYIPWEPPRVPVNGPYDLVYVLPDGVFVPHPEPVELTCAQEMSWDPRVKTLLDAAKLREKEAPALPARSQEFQLPESASESEEGQE